MIKKLLLLLLSIGIFLGCSMPDATGNNDNGTGRWMQGYGPSRGHEDLTRFAVEEANKFLKDDFFPMVEYGDNGVFSDHPIVDGNYSTDFPDTRMKEHYGFTDDMSSSEWANHPGLMTIHSLRNQNPDGTLQAKVDAYLEWKGRIFSATKHALTVYQSGNVEEGLYWFGHNLHMIQDSFSPAHTARVSKNDIAFMAMTDLNSYGIEVEGIGYHHTVDIGDRIWANNSCWNPSCREWECLRGEAQAASTAGGGYLYVVAELIKGNLTNIDDTLEKYFEGDINIPNSGYLTSSHL